jgi:1-phosphofructokinase family hexose kinase
MIITVTPNAALDKTIQVPSLQLGMRHRAARGDAVAGGKGINVARALRLLQEPVIATGLAGGSTGRRIVTELTAEGILNDFVQIREESRTSTVLIDPTTGTQTEILEYGPTVTEAERGRLIERLEYLCRDAYAVVLAGSLPRDVPVDWYADAIRALRRTGTKVVLDTEGEPLRLGVAAEPDLVAPNQAEAEELVGHEFSSDADLVTALDEIADMGPRNVLITVESGLYALIREGGQTRRFRVEAPAVEVLSTVGAGDALLAGYLAARLREATAEEALTQAVACGSANTLVAGAGVFNPRDLRRLEHETATHELLLR